MGLKSLATKYDMATKWKQFNLGDVCTAQGSSNSLIKGKQIQEYKSGLYPAFSATGQDIWREEFEHEGSAIIVSAVGARCGKCFKADGKWTAIANTHIIFPKENISRDYLFYYINNENFWEKGGVAQPFVKIRDTLRRKSIPFPVDKNGNPDLAEQKRIVATLEEAESLKKKRVEADQKMNELVPALFVKMFGDLSRWPHKKLGEGLAEFRYGTSVKCDYKILGLPVLRIPNILGGKINLHDLKYCKLDESEVKKLLLNNGDTLFVRTNGNPDYVGRCAVFDLNEKYLFASYLIRARFDQKVVNPLFLATFLRTGTGRNTMLPAIRTTAGQSNINIEGLKSVTIPLPSIDLQNKFAETVKEIEAQKEKQKQSAIQLEVLFSSLLSRSFVS